MQMMRVIHLRPRQSKLHKSSLAACTCRLCGEQTGAHRTQYIYYPNSFTPMCCLQDDKAYFYHTDHLGTPMEMTDEDGYRVWFGTYGTFGHCHVKDSSVIENNLRLAGQYYDSESRLHYNCFRYYDAIVGRYISQDPFGYMAGDFNLYRYCYNDPVKDYEDEVAKLKDKAASMREDGYSEEEIARILHHERNALKVRYRKLTPSDMLNKIENRNIQKYGNKIGPSVEQLIAL
jgi:RHS repeat-associated protein